MRVEHAGCVLQEKTPRGMRGGTRVVALISSDRRKTGAGKGGAANYRARRKTERANVVQRAFTARSTN